MRSVRRTAKTRRTVPFTLPAPVGGLNGRDGIADMPASDAFILDNAFPANTTVDQRKGYAPYATGLGGPVESVEAYVGGADTHLLACAAGSLYDITSGGIVGAPIKSGLISSILNTSMFSNAGDQFLICVTGADTPFSYKASGATNLAITGVTGTPADFIDVHTFKGRLYFVQKRALGFYYLAPGAIQGAASYFDLSQIAKKGGSVVAVASFSQQDSGTGPQDYLVFATSEGEYIVYGGIDPSNAATWSLVGRYYSSAPIGRHGKFNFRSDLYFITDEGLIAFSQIREQGEQGDSTKYLSSKLGRYLAELTTHKATQGWQAVLHPPTGMLILNAPTTQLSSGAYVQFAMNTDSNAWCRFTGMNALCWNSYSDRLFFGTYDGRVMRADYGSLDDGKPINIDARQAYNYFDDGKGMGAFDKHFHFATFVIETDGSPPVSAELNVNFENTPPQYEGTLSPSGGSYWDIDTWDNAVWADEAAMQTFTVPFGKLGYAASIWLRVRAAGTTFRWYATRVFLEKSDGVILP